MPVRRLAESTDTFATTNLMAAVNPADIAAQPGQADTTMLSKRYAKRIKGQIQAPKRPSSVWFGRGQPLELAQNWPRNI
jgi:hypothetical protein